MTDNRKTALEFAHNNKDTYLNELIELTKIPSISTDPQYKDEMKTAAGWLEDKLKETGMENVEIMETGGHPVMYGESLNAGNDAPTVLIYGHYNLVD